MKYRMRLLPAAAAIVIAASGLLLLTGVFTSEAVQNPRISLDMVTSGNAYDETTNTMTVGSIENCLTSATANPNTHTHPTHLVIQDVEDLVAFQVRLNYIGDKMRPLTFNSTPFTDNNTSQSVGFINLPIDQSSGVHRAVTPAVSIPTAPADDTNTPQTALVGAAYNETQDAPVSPDTPAKAVPDDTSYNAPNGGVLGLLVMQVLGNESGDPSLFMNLDDNNPNPPGSAVVVFTGTGTTTINIAPSQLGDGFHGEGVTCVPLDCTTQECPAPSVTPTPEPQTPTPTPCIALPPPLPTCAPTIPPISATPTATATPSPTPTATATATAIVTPTSIPTVTASPTSSATATATEAATATATASLTATATATVTATATATPAPTPTATATPAPVAGHDARLTKIGGVPRNARLSPGEVINDSANVVVANESNHTETIGVYVDVFAPSGCTPSGRMLQTTVALAAGAKTTIQVPVSYSCSNVSSADGLSYSWTAVADHGGDDLASCGPGALQSLGCFNALGNDDEDPADNRKSRTGPRVVAQ
jgi:hypothetical protein